MRSHIVFIHTEENNYACELCDKSFKTNGQLKSHKETVHVTTRAFVCDATYKEKTSLRRHIKRTHESFKSFSCDQCEKAFNNKDSLIIHL